MLIHHIILLLLSWGCVRAIKDEKPPPEGMIDQLATASENQRVSHDQSKSPQMTVESSKGSTTLEPINVGTVHYENSNGFVPMTSIDYEESNSPDALEMNTGNEDSETEAIEEVSRTSEKIEDDPAYSTEARMFLNLAGPGADRRSFDTQDTQSEFEILKVNKETPAVANYHEFYENVENNLGRNRGGIPVEYEDGSGDGRTTTQNKRTKDRIKHIEKYFTNYQVSEDQKNVEPYDQFYNNYRSGKPGASNRQKDIFEPSKVQSFAEQSAVSNYDVYNESSQQHKTSGLPKSSSHDSSMTSSRPNYPTITPKQHRYAKPVIVVEPGDYKLDMKYGTQQVSAKSSSTDHHRTQKHRKASPEMESSSQYDDGSRVNREDRYGPSYERSEDVGDYSGEDEYMEITEKPKRIHKNRRRPHSTENSRRLPKEHRSHSHDDQHSEDPRKNTSPTRSKLHRPRAKPSYWIEDDQGSSSDENSEEVIDKPSVVSKSEDKKPKQGSKQKGVPTWSQVAPNIEVSHSNGFEIAQIDKPKLLVPVNLNLLPLSNFDHSAAIGNSQGFDFTNVPNLVTATPIVSSQPPILSTGHSLANNAHGNSANPSKHHQNSVNNNNYGLSTPAPEIIVGQNSYHNPVQAVLLPQMNVNNKFSPNIRTHYSPSTVAPMFTVTHTLNNNLQNIGPTMASIPLQNYQSTVTPRPANQFHQNMHHLTVNPSAAPQLLLPQPTLQSIPLLHGPYNGHSNYNIFVNPNGLHGQNVIQNGNANGPSGTGQNSPSSTTTPQPNTISNIDYNPAETQVRKNIGTNSNGQYVTTASFSVGNQGPSSTGNENKYYLPTNNNNNNNFYNGNQNNQQVVRPQQQENYYQIYRDDQNVNGKVKTYVQTAQVLPAIIHQPNAVSANLNNEHHTNFGGQLQGQHSILTPNVVLHSPRNQNQQILNAANDIFENTWKQLQQLRTNEDAARRLPFQHVYRVNDNLGSTSNVNGNTVNGLPGVNVNSANAHLPIMANQNVEIINPNIKPSPVDTSVINHYEAFNHYPAAVLTTPIPIFSTTASFLVPRPIVASTTPMPINLHNYVDQLTHLGAQSNQVNKVEARPGFNHQDNQRPVYNPINFVPNSDLMKSQSMLNSKNTEPLPNQLNLVPLIPGGNFYKNSPGAQTELVQKPRLSSDLEKYAEEMFKESLRTIYSTHKWNNDRRFRGNYSAAELNELAKLKSELQRYKASMSDSKYGPKDILEAHHSETNVRTTDSSGRPTKKPELSMADIEQLFKSDFKLNLPPSGESSLRGSHSKNRQNQSHGSSRPASPNEHSNDFRNIKHLSDFLTPPKVNSFLSKSPFIDPPKSGKKRPGSHSPRFNSNNGNSRHLPRPSSLVSRPSSNPDASASNHVESGVKADGHHRYEKYRSYPTFTTTTTPDSSEQFSKTDYYDINHPRMHNLLGLLMKNKQLPKGSAQSFFRDEDELRQYFENERRRVHTDFFNENNMRMQKKSDFPINMGPPAPPHFAQIRPYPTQIA